MTPCYELKFVKIKNEVVGARPIGWNDVDIDGFGHDASGNDVMAVEWMTTCPYCGNMVQFEVAGVAKIKTDDQEDEYVSCGECGAGAEFIPESSKSGLDESNPVDVDSIVLDVADFMDPLNEDFGFEIDYDRMPGV